MVVELDVFSGRPNPKWPLTEDEAAKVTKLIQGLESAAGDRMPEPPGLGYRGFRLRDLTGSQYWAYGGLISVSNVLLADPRRRVERYLLEHLPAEYNELRQLVKADLGPS